MIDVSMTKLLSTRYLVGGREGRRGKVGDISDIQPRSALVPSIYPACNYGGSLRQNPPNVCSSHLDINIYTLNFIFKI